MTAAEKQEETKEEIQKKELPKGFFKTRNDQVIALKPWTIGMLVQNAEALLSFAQTMMDISTGGEVDLKRLQSVLPALKASVQDEQSIEKIIGMADLVDFIEHVWDFNEIGVGLGKAVRLQMKMQKDLLGGSGGALSLS